MSQAFVIRHPINEQPVVLKHFLASGGAPAGTRITGSLISLGKDWNNGSAKKIPCEVYHGEVRRQPPNWIIEFKVPEDGYYILIVRIRNRARTVLFRIVRSRTHANIQIGHPTAPGPVDGSQVISGYVYVHDSSTSVTGRLKCTQGHGGSVTEPVGSSLVGIDYDVSGEPDSHNTFTCEAWETGDMLNAANPEAGIQVDNLARSAKKGKRAKKRIKRLVSTNNSRKKQRAPAGRKR